jgi:aspartate/methionine/tyrosine aminotransferase
MGGFFLWLDVGDGEKAAVELWRRAAIKVLPGEYLARADAAGSNPGNRFIRVALVHEPEDMEPALKRMAGVLSEWRTRQPASQPRTPDDGLLAAGR